MRVAVYVRVSTDDQARRGYSLAEQRAACEARAREMGAESVVFFSDEGVSGEVIDRPGLAALRAAVRARLVDVILVRDADRLSRRLAHQLILAEEFERAGVRLEFIDFSWQDTPEGRLFFSIRSAIAEYEKEKIRDRTSRGRLQKARQGGIPTSFDVYGYTYNRETGQVEVKTEEAAIVRMVFEWFVRGDAGLNGIARRLNEMGVPTRRRKGPWHRQVVKQILMQRAYTGTWYYGRRDWQGTSLNRYRHEPDRISAREKPPEEWIPITVPPIIEQNLWDRANEKLKEARRLWAGLSRETYLLSGILTCQACGNPLYGTRVTWWGRKERRYTCRRTAHGKGVRPACRPATMLPAQYLEDAIWRLVCKWVGDGNFLATTVRELITDKENRLWELQRLDALIAEVERGQENLITLVASGAVTLDSSIVNRLVELRRRSKDLLAQKSRLEQETAVLAARESDQAMFQRSAWDFLGQAWSWEPALKRRVLRLLVKHVYVHPGEGSAKVIYR